MNSRTSQLRPGRQGWGALRIAGIYLLIGALWILFPTGSQRVSRNDPATLTTISIYKGWGFIVVTALLLYWLIQQHTSTLRESEEKMRLVTDSVPALISYVDSNRYYQFSNQAYEEWFGYKADGKRLDEVSGSTAYEAISKYVDAALRGETVNYQTEIPYPDGSTRFVEATYVPDRTKDGNVRDLCVSPGYFGAQAGGTGDAPMGRRLRTLCSWDCHWRSGFQSHYGVQLCVCVIAQVTDRGCCRFIDSQPIRGV